MSRHWVGTWTATPAPAEGISLSAPTIRMFPRISIGGDIIRVRLSNAAGTSDLVIAATRVALRGEGIAAIRPGTDRAVTFNGSPASSTSAWLNVSIPNGTYAYSIGPVSGYAQNRTSGSVQVAGSDVTIAVSFSPTTPATPASFPALLVGLSVVIVAAVAIAAVILARRRRRPPSASAREGSTPPSTGTG